MKIAVALTTAILTLSTVAVAADKSAPTSKATSQKAAPKAKAKILDKHVLAATPVSPERIQLAANVTIVPNMLDPAKRVGVLTHEGVFGPLLYAEKMRAFFIELKAGMYLEEHPHDAESLIYTISGKWVLVSEGKRQVMETGSVFHFGSRMPTGWETPFAGGALLYVVKSKKPGDNYQKFMDGISKMQADVDKQRKDGVPFYFNALKPDHPAVVFAKSVNPDFDAVLKNIPY
jgi:quercetin dioxygenase-like cupin family protein